ncbi:MAG: TetR/AcrR family transcriptional regulator [Lachnospiraceae bacterium]|nr:TetR/AcrR family transcriptional regulator [Lachnospiraceae bacterium]
MYKKLDEETLNNLLETGIKEFAYKGFDKASIADIAKKSGLSVGVLYKYFADKDDFFISCIRYSLKLLDSVMKEVTGDGRDLIGNMEIAVRRLIEHARNHTEYYVMYHEITAGGCRKFASMLAEEIETVSATVYTNLIENARSKGLVREDLDAKMFAFFFDNLLMMLQFSLSCEYYKERMRIYCGGEPTDEMLVKEMLRFMNSALGIK